MAIGLFSFGTRRYDPYWRPKSEKNILSCKSFWHRKVRTLLSPKVWKDISPAKAATEHPGHAVTLQKTECRIPYIGRITTTATSFPLFSSQIASVNENWQIAKKTFHTGKMRFLSMSSVSASRYMLRDPTAWSNRNLTFLYVHDVGKSWSQRSKVRGKAASIRRFDDCCLERYKSANKKCCKVPFVEIITDLVISEFLSIPYIAWIKLALRGT